jgi:lipid-A-disaccharide synthase
MSELLVVAGEASGDLHAARLLAALRRLRPDLRVFGLADEEVAAAGAELVARSSEIAVVGITEVLKVIPRARQIFRSLLAETARRRPAAALLVDFPDFNLRLARRLWRMGVPVVYYVSPQVWAWRRRRVRQIARHVHTMLVLFPFEVDFYRGHAVAVEHVGHPLVDEVPPDLPQAWEQAPPPPYRVALLPGSRRSEVAALLPVQLAAAERLAARAPVEVRLVRAPGLPREVVAAHLGRTSLAVEVVERDRFAAVAGSHLAFCASGTATLEVALLGTPLVVLYRLQRWTYLLGRLLVRLPSFSLVNLVLGRRVVPELLQEEASPERLADEGWRLLADAEARRDLRAGLAEVRGRLGEGGASERAAAAVHRVLGGVETAA